ncbi:MAG: 2-oxoacid:ferredoxin oxidoreductase subunit beta [Thermaerobacterales bacterium]
MTATVTVKDFAGDVRPTWCPGCGDFGILNALKKSLADEQIAPHEVMVVSGIGCGSKITDYIHANGFMTLHGRPLPVATGIKLANPDLQVVIINGDGDAYGIGGNHFIHTCRRNLNLTHIVENNQIYALTKGQYSPTSDRGFRTTTSPDGAPEWPIIPTALAFSAGASFIARTYAGSPKDMAAVFKAGLNHRGYALIDVLQPCVTFNKVNTYEWYEERSYDVGADEAYDPEDRRQAWEKVSEWGDRIPLGILYRRNDLPVYEDGVGALDDGPVARRSLRELDEATFEDLKEELL